MFAKWHNRETRSCAKAKFSGQEPWGMRSRLLESGHYLSRIGKSSRFKLGEHQIAVNDDIEDATAPGDQLCLRTKALA